jgi:ribosomal protein S18 acetylase RimI-like enzyme
MSETQNIEVLDLRHYSARQLRPLLEQEAAIWEERLGWDYRSSIELLLQYLDSRILPGFVASIRGRLCGFAFCVYEGHKAVIGDVFVSPEIVQRAAVTEALLRHLLEVLEASPDIDRIESQLLLFETGVLTRPFAALGFTLFPRLYEECNLAGKVPELRTKIVELGRFPAPLELRSWNPNLYQATAELIHGSYAGHIDAGINDQYKSLHGSLRFLHNIIRFPGCGSFEPNCSWVLLDPKANGLAAVVLCSKIGPGMAHVTQLCVAPAWRGRRLGEQLMLHSMVHLASAGYRAITLTVTEANEAAVRLYAGLGFWTRHRFEAMVRNKADGGDLIVQAKRGKEDATGPSPTFFSASRRAT